MDSDILSGSAIRRPIYWLMPERALSLSWQSGLTKRSFRSSSGSSRWSMKPRGRTILEGFSKKSVNAGGKIGVNEREQIVINDRRYLLRTVNHRSGQASLLFIHYYSLRSNYSLRSKSLRWYNHFRYIDIELQTTRHTRFLRFPHPCHILFVRDR